jgi:histone H3/H4
MAKSTKPAKKAAKTVSKEILIVGSKMKDVVKNAGCMSSGDLIEALSNKVHEILASAAERAKGNGRSTVRPYDL